MLLYFERLALIMDKKVCLNFLKKDNIVSNALKGRKDSYVPDFLTILQSHKMFEKAFGTNNH
jgi:hypothetical protein